MKVKTISRDNEEFTRSITTAPTKQFFTKDTNIHRYEKPREYIRSLNAAKTQKIYAKPFVLALDGHIDTPISMCLHPDSIVNLVSGSAIGELKIWDIGKQKVLMSVDNAHNGFINGMVFDPLTKSHFFSVGTDKTLKRWKYLDPTPKQVYTTDYGLYCVDHHNDDSILVTGGDRLDLWDSTRTIPKQSFEPCDDSITVCKFNKVEKSLVAMAAKNNSVYLYDIKSGINISQFAMKKKTNDISWNPMNPFCFSIANDDMNCYTFDMRKLDKGPTIMHAGHLNAVMSIDYSPTGLEFCTGSYDKTIRIFKADSTQYNSREVYHTKRMQRVWKVKYTIDSKFVLSGSDDYIIRVWKSEAAQPLRHMSKDEMVKLNYDQKLVEKFKDVPEVKKISLFKRLPKKLALDKKTMKAVRDAEVRATIREIKYRHRGKKPHDAPKPIQKNWKKMSD